MKKHLLAVVPSGLLLLSSTAFAQQSIVDHCRQSSTQDDQIACLEAALLGRDSALSTAPPIVEAASEPTAETSPAPEPEPVPEPAPTPVEEETPVGIGADQVVARNMSREEHLQSLESEKGLAVASYDTLAHGKLLVTLENGQVWRQIKGDTQKIRVSLKRNQTVDISESSISGYKMQLNEMRRSVRVERIK